jgi:hypothetical protein
VLTGLVIGGTIPLGGSTITVGLPTGTEHVLTDLAGLYSLPLDPGKYQGTVKGPQVAQQQNPGFTSQDFYQVTVYLPPGTVVSVWDSVVVMLVFPLN